MITTLLALCLFTARLAAATLPVDSVVINSANELVSFVAGGFTYGQANLIQPNLTAFTGNPEPVGDGNFGNISLPEGGSLPPVGRRSILLTGDFRLDTGIINPDFAPNAATLTFVEPLINRQGPELVMFEGGGIPDSFQLRINSNVVVYSPEQYGLNLTPPLLFNTFTRDDGVPENVGELENGSYTRALQGSDPRHGIAIDLDDFGVGPLATVSTVNFGSAGNASFDPSLFMGIGGSEGPTGPNGQIELSGFGQTYTQDFDVALGSDGTAVGTPLPTGWSTDNLGTIETTITETFPTTVVATKTYNAGTESDRTLATGHFTSDSSSAIQLWGQIKDPNDVRAVFLESRVEAWFGLEFLADDPGEAAFVVSLEFDPTGGGSFSTAHTFNEGVPVTTGLSLSPKMLDGNGGAGLSFSSGLVELDAPIPAGSTIRLTFDAQGVGQTQGYIFGVDDITFRIVAPGDTDGNGKVDMTDISAIVDAGKFNNPAAGAASWAEGDYNGDDLVDSADLFLILGAGKFKQGPYSSVLVAVQAAPEPGSFTLITAGVLALIAFAWRRKGG